MYGLATLYVSSHRHRLRLLIPSKLFCVSSRMAIHAKRHMGKTAGVIVRVCCSCFPSFPRNTCVGVCVCVSSYIWICSRQAAWVKNHDSRMKCVGSTVHVVLSSCMEFVDALVCSGGLGCSLWGSRRGPIVCTGVQITHRHPCRSSRKLS